MPTKNPYSVQGRRPLKTSPGRKPSSPLPQHKKAADTTQSENSTDENESDLDNSAIFHSRSSSPNSFENSKNSLTSSDLTELRIRKTETQFEYSQNLSITGSPKNDRKSKIQPNVSQTESPGKGTNLIAWIIPIILAVVVISVYALSNRPKVSAELIKCPQFKELMEHFAHQDKFMWKSLKVNIENVLNKNPSKPSVFLLAYNDRKSSKHIMTKILNATANCMKSTNPIELDGGSFANDSMVEDYGQIIQKYRKRLEHEGIMYVADVNKTPARAAQVFHTICDTVTPLVERAVIFFTVYVDQYDKNMPSQNVSLLVEQLLEHDWYKDNAVSKNTLKALIGRVTDQVFLLHPENDL